MQRSRDEGRDGGGGAAVTMTASLYHSQIILIVCNNMCRNMRLLQVTGLSNQVYDICLQIRCSGFDVFTTDLQHKEEASTKISHIRYISLLLIVPPK